MSNPVNNNIVPHNQNVGENLTGKPNFAGDTRIGQQQSDHIFNNLTDNLNKNPNFAKGGNNKGDELPANFRNNNGRGNQTEITEKPNPRDQAPPRNNTGNRGNGNNGNVNNENGNNGKGNNGNNNTGNGNNRASAQGLAHGRGHHKGETLGENPAPKPFVTTPQPPVRPNNNNENNAQNNNGNANQNVQNNNGNGVNQNTQNNNNGNGINQNNNGNGVNQNNPVNNGNGVNQNQQPISQPKPLILTNQPTVINQNALENQHGDEHHNDNRENNFTRQVVRQVLRENNIFLNKGIVNQILKDNPNQTNNQGRPVNVPTELKDLVQNIKNNIVITNDGSQKLNGKSAQNLAVNISNQLQEQIKTTKNIIFQQTDLGAKHFENVNIKERMLFGIDMMPKHLPNELSDHFQNHQPKEVLNGMLLARGLIIGNENIGNLRDFVISQPTILPQNVNLTAMRDVGQLVKILIADSALAKTTANLDLSVQKFIRILLANNELGVLLASISLASQTRLSGGLISRSLALAQIYEFITRLILAGDKAMKQVGNESLAKTLPQDKDLNKSLIQSRNKDENVLVNSKTNSVAESALRQFLEFNPALIMDRSTSAFDNSEKVRQSQQKFASLYQDEISLWLQSGNHRLVKDFDLDKPVGIVIERNSNEVFSANTVRMVLVRDSSVQGWHFLKSFLVK